MIKTIKGNIFDHIKENTAMIHVCNNRGGYSGGPTAIATQVKQRYPSAYNNYMDKLDLSSVSASDCLHVINMVAQDGYGNKGQRYLNYGAFAKCLSLIAYNKDYLDSKDIDTILVPVGMGADRAGGDWEIVKEMVDFILGSCFYLVYVEFDG